MSFYTRYELLELVRGDGVKVFHAREITTGRMVEVHLFTSGWTPENQAVLTRVRELNEADLKVVLDIGEHEGTPFVVTELPQGYRSLLEWLDAVVPKKAPPRATADTDRFARAGQWRIPASVVTPAPTASPAPAAEAGEFTRMFKLGAVPPPASPPAPPPASPPASPEPAPSDFEAMFGLKAPAAPPPPPPEKPPAAAAPGEFTRMFQSVQPPPPAPVSPGIAELKTVIKTPDRPAAPPPPAPPPRQEPGEFTRMFQTPSQPAPPPAPPKPAAEEVGEFTRFFQGPLQPTPLKPVSGTPSSYVPPVPVGPAKALDAPGEFTRMFGKSDIPTAPPGMSAPLPPPAPPPPPPGGSATQAFAIRSAPPPPAAPSAEVQQGPSEFTQMFAAPRPAAPPSTPAPTPAPPIQKSSNLPLILGLAGIALIALFVILYFALK